VHRENPEEICQTTSGTKVPKANVWNMSTCPV